MSLDKYYYLITDIVFAGSAILIIYHRHKKSFRKHWVFIMDFTLFALPFAYLDRYALKWGAWQYNPAHNLGFLFFGEEIEGYIFMGLVAAAVASYTVANAKVYGYKTTTLTRSAKTKKTRLSGRRPAVAASSRR
jgi:lycopene cyclase domain-containing protein